LPASDDHQVFTNVMENFYHYCIQEGIDGVVFGDIFLEDLKTFRINLLKPTKLFASFPLWGMDSRTIVNDFIQAGFKSTICAADANLLSKTLENYVALFNLAFSRRRSCGENGSFSFVFDGQYFNTLFSLIGEL
jgi:diphthamide synthase (EF-2-diphthine--ammonia ligase)